MTVIGKEVDEMPKCFGGCGKELQESGLCEECEWTCPVCTGTGTAKRMIIGGDKDFDIVELTMPKILASFAELLDLVLSQGGSVHNIDVSLTRTNQIRIRVVGHEFIKFG